MNPTIDELAFELEVAKAKEASANAARIGAEQRLIELLGAKEEGAETHRGDQYKVTITGVMNRRFDAEALAGVAVQLSPELMGHCVRYKPEPISEGICYLRNNEPEAYAVLATALKVTPGKAQVRIERAQEKAVA